MKTSNLYIACTLLLWRHIERDGVSNHRRFDGFLNRLFRQIKENIKAPRNWTLCEGNSPETGEFPSQRASDAENASIWWRHRDADNYLCGLSAHSATNSNGKTFLEFHGNVQFF